MARGKASEKQQIEIQERWIKALDLRRAGGSYRSIATQLGISHEQARQDITQALTELKAIEGNDAEELRTLELERLDGMTLAFWQKAIKGDLGAAHFVLKVSESRRKLAGIDAPAKQEQTGTLTLTVDYADPLPIPELGAAPDPSGLLPTGIDFTSGQGQESKGQGNGTTVEIDFA